MFHYLVDLVSISMETIIIQFIEYPQQDQNTASHPNGKANNVNKEGTFMSFETPKCSF
jgi:hypothetical protein